MTRTRRAFSLVEILVVIVLIAVMAAMLLPRYLSGATAANGKKADSPVNKARGVECRNNLSQIRMSMQALAVGDEENRPRSLADLKLPSSMLVCPVGKQPYRFDPATRRVWCAYPNHQGF